MARIDDANRSLQEFQILKGIEVDIREDGTLDLPDSVLGELDIVLASIHSGFRQSREQITARLLSAVRNPLVGIIAHPTGRLLGERDPYDADMEAVLREAAARGVAMEVNAHPARLDLSDYHVRMAKRYGVPLVISTDAHFNADFDYVEYGVMIARRGWAVSGDVLNTLPCRSLLKKLRSGRNPVASSRDRNA
jgi:DNA polymerase (family 10)